MMTVHFIFALGVVTVTFVLCYMYRHENNDE